MPDSWSSD